MIPLVDIHCHLLAGLDDGPRTDKDALAMCRIAYEDGTRFICATAHQNDRWSEVTPEGIVRATAKLAGQLREAKLPLTVEPCAEVMVHPEMEDSWRDKRLLSIGRHDKYLLIEMPHGLFVHLPNLVSSFFRQGLRPILAHPERTPELLEDQNLMTELIEAGCLMQVSARSITDPAATGVDHRKVKSWIKRGFIHLLGSDGHSPRHRTPRLAEAYQQIASWVGNNLADRICSANGMAVMQGLPVKALVRQLAATRWFPKFW